MGVSGKTETDVVPYGEATRTWTQIALRSFGGPAAQIAVMHRELVEEKKWIGEQRFLHALSFCTLLPGPEAQQLSIYLGLLLNGTRGGLTAGSLFVLPGFVVLMMLSAMYARWGSSAAVTALFAGLAPAILAIVAQALYRVARRSLRTRLHRAIAVSAFIALFVLNVPFPLVVVAAGVVGWFGDRSRSFRSPDGSSAHNVSTHTEPTAVTPAPPLVADDQLYGEPASFKRSVKIVAFGFTAWGVPILAVLLLLGSSHVLITQALFFTVTALVTFGGAYSVLSFVADRAVGTYGWLAPGEMVNGLALAESTPGPLIMVVQFVGFLGAFRDPGALNPWLAGVLGATLVVWVTFVPSFVFVFVGAPYIEGLRSNRSLSSALAGISAAVVGVIANLSIFFAIHTLFDRTSVERLGPIKMELPEWSSVKPSALAVAALATVLVFRFKLSVVRVLTICALFGGVLHLLQ
jgi:chromate transporter